MIGGGSPGPACPFGVIGVAGIGVSGGFVGIGGGEAFAVWGYRGTSITSAPPPARTS
jgi:hypothetical protein